MRTLKPLPPEALCKYCDPNLFDFTTTDELEDLSDVIGQTRAVDSIQFGIGIRRDGYNLYAMGLPGTGKHSIVERFVSQQALSEPSPSDWCYVHNFKETHRPTALEFPSGMGEQFRQDMENLLTDLRSAIPSTFEREEYRVRRKAIEEEFEERQNEAFNKIQEQAQSRGLTLLRTPTGLVFAPYQDGKVLSPEEFEQLPDDLKQKLESEVKQLQDELQKILHHVPIWERELRQRIEELNHEVVTFVIDPLLKEIRGKYETLSHVIDYLNAVQRDVVDNFEDFLLPQTGPKAGGTLPGLPAPAPSPDTILRRYRVNLLVRHDGAQGAPIVYEDNPAYQNLVGRIEYMAQMGALTTDFTLIKPGALHRANGGYLMLDAHRLFAYPFAWEGLKRTLRAKQIRIETPGQMISQINTITLEPEPIPLNVKIILLGDRMIYYLLANADPDFEELFKVAADFDDDMDRDPDTQRLYAQLIATLARKQSVRPLERSAVARLIDYSARLVGDAEKLTARMESIVDLMQEADYWADRDGNGVLLAKHVQQAIDARIRRSNRIQERTQEAILRDFIRIDTEGEVVGQINGLSVMQLGNFSFGRPSRITARIRLGRGEVIDIEREVALSGAIHSKGVLILSSFLGARYAVERPLSLSASLVFEQSYGGVDGDSASSTELYALLSAIAEVPIKQSFAVTGSVDQYGNVQVIGGVNEKIEGFFDVCKARGLTGDQGVLIPAGNVKNLMLKQEVIDAVEAGQFHIYPVEHIDQGIELLTGIPAGERDENGEYPEGSINQRVEARLSELAEVRAKFGKGVKENNESSNDE
jgi:lon-related putative ATP-dependent protease